MTGHGKEWRHGRGGQVRISLERKLEMANHLRPSAVHFSFHDPGIGSLRLFYHGLTDFSGLYGYNRKFENLNVLTQWVKLGYFITHSWECNPWFPNADFRMILESAVSLVV
jgi:hypothetical protein